MHVCKNSCVILFIGSKDAVSVDECRIITSLVVGVERQLADIAEPGNCRTKAFALSVVGYDAFLGNSAIWCAIGVGFQCFVGLPTIFCGVQSDPTSSCNAAVVCM